MQEEWKAIPGFEGLYDASNLGRIRSHPGKVTSSRRFYHRVWETRIMKAKHPTAKKRQDDRVSLWKDGKPTDHLVSRLVASAWHGAPENGMTVNHIDGDWKNNKADNLEWTSLAENIRHGYKTGLFESIQKGVALVDSNGESTIFLSLAEASRFLKRNHGYIHCLIKRNSNNAVSADGNVYTISKII